MSGGREEVAYLGGIRFVEGLGVTEETTVDTLEGLGAKAGKTTSTGNVLITSKESMGLPFSSRPFF